MPLPELCMLMHGGSVYAVGLCMLNTKYMLKLFRAYPLQKQVFLGEKSALLKAACTRECKLS